MRAYDWSDVPCHSGDSITTTGLRKVRMARLEIKDLDWHLGQRGQVTKYDGKNSNELVVKSKSSPGLVYIYIFFFSKLIIAEVRRLKKEEVWLWNYAKGFGSVQSQLNLPGRVNLKEPFVSWCVCVCVEIVLTASHSGCCFGFVVCTVNVAPSSRKLPSSIKLVVRELLFVMCPVKRCASKLHWVTGLMVMWSLMSSDVGLTY